jgi:spore coat polysaccharide biosynthesis protein SpsF (cytidylyltransferase family)
MTVCGLIQAHYLGWDGARDRSLATLDGKLVIEHVIAKLKAMPIIDQVILAVPDCRGNTVFLKLADKHRIHCHFGPAENVLERCRQAIEVTGADEVIHVMGQHCFTDADLLANMLAFLHQSNAHYVSMPDDFSPDFAGKIYERKLLDHVAKAIDSYPAEDRPARLARFCSYIESEGDWFRALVYPHSPAYTDEFRNNVRALAAGIFKDERISVDETNASSISNPISESYEIAAAEIEPADHVLDIACGNGHGSRILAAKARCVTAVDLDGRLIARNRRNNRHPNLFYKKGNALDLPVESASADAVTAMEFIEHLQPIEADRFLAETRRLLAPSGKLFISTPQNGNGSIPVCPHHIKEYSRPEFEALLRPHFDSVRILCSKSGGRLSEANQTGQKMLAICQ